MRREGREAGIAVPALLGAAVGLLSGLFGVGGGILIVPGLVLLPRMGQRRAHATSLAAIAPIAAAGALGYANSGAVDWKAAGILAAGSALGAAFGTRILARVPERWLSRAFVVFLLVSAASFPFEADAAGTAASITAASVLVLASVGIAAGSLAGVLGVGGGIVTVPALTLLFSVSPIVAKGTSLVVIIPTALVGSLVNVRAGNADLRVAAPLAVTGTMVALVASLLAVRIDPVVSAVSFAALLVAVAVRMALARPPCTSS